MIDVTFNFQDETLGRDPDTYSLTLQEYHRVLWSKPLPSGKVFSLTKIKACRLYHKSEVGEFTLSSDRVIPSFSKWKRMQYLVEQLPSDYVDSFVNLTNTAGGIMIWPSNRIDGKATMNGERGFNSKIADRMDLTIECIRLYYLAKDSPLFNTLERYSNFFDIFQDFRGFVEFFLLQDAVSNNFQSVNIAVPFDEFMSPPIPKNLVEYRNYLDSTAEFVIKRSRRIEEYANSA